MVGKKRVGLKIALGSLHTSTKNFLFRGASVVYTYECMGERERILMKIDTV